MDSPKSYRVIVEPEAIKGIENAFSWIYSRSPNAAAQWRQGLYDAILSLSSLPNRCAYAPEMANFDIEIRQLLYGRRGSVYRILFVVNEEASTVDVLYVRHGARDRLTPENNNEV